MTAAEWLEGVKDAERRGELLAAVDLAEQGLGEHPDDFQLRHRAVLALARSGSTSSAAQRYQDYGLENSADEDVAALGARIAKDEALASDGDLRRRRAAEAAEAYRTIYERTGGYYPAINAATLNLIAGDEDGARELAAEALRLLTAEGSYYEAATEAEAHLLLGDEAEARESLQRAASAARGDHGALAITRRQLRAICDELGTGPELLDPLSGPAVIHYCGHRISAPGERGRFPADAEAGVAAAVADEVRRHPAGYAYGSLAAGADILWAEALLDCGCELHLVLPFAHDEFIRSSVAPSGRDWEQRFHRCLAAAREVTLAVDDAFLGDDVLYRYGAELAMGLTLLRARYLDADVRQLAVWDGGAADGEAGTAVDVEVWRSNQRQVSIISPLPGSAAHPEGVPDAVAEPRSRRVVRALLFADVEGFSALTDEQLPSFAEFVLGAFGKVLARYAGQIEHQNSWGDALYVVLTDVVDAANCALDLQAAIAKIDLEAAGLPAQLALRMGGHIGPGFPTWDPVIGEMAFMGSHVSRTARIEPVTPAGSVYVTSAFAAALALAAPSDLVCDYVGHMPAAKDFGRLRMYRLWRRQASIG